MQSTELREKRKAFQEAETVRKEQEAVRSMQEARDLSQAAERDQARKEVEYREAAAQETARLWEQQKAARRAFEEQEALMGEEIARKTEIEVQLRMERKKIDEERLRSETEAQAREEAEAERARELKAKKAEVLRKKRQEGDLFWRAHLGLTDLGAGP